MINDLLFGIPIREIFDNFDVEVVDEVIRVALTQRGKLPQEFREYMVARRKGEIATFEYYDQRRA